MDHGLVAVAMGSVMVMVMVMIPVLVLVLAARRLAKLSSIARRHFWDGFISQVHSQFPTPNIRLPQLRSRSRHRHRSASSSPVSTVSLLLRYPWPLLFLAHPVLADCECGYSTSIDGSPVVFTDLIESDFTRFAQDHVAQLNTDWAPQAFNLTRERARGDYGEMFAVENVFVANPSSSSSYSEGQGESAGLGLVVRSKSVDGMVPVAEMDTRRLDLLWGTYRASMKMTDVPGTCAAFFWYLNDTQEIDMEFLSKDFNSTNSSYPVNLVLQSREAALAGYDASRTGNFAKAYLPFDPTEDFHEYRIDYTPGKVLFYADGRRLAEMDGPAVPSTAGHLILQHWSNGNKFWSGGPPAEDATLMVRYVKAYFNSSSSQRQQDWAARCRDPAAPNAVCGIRDGMWFFKDQGNMTNNQTVYGESEGSSLETTLRWRTIGLVMFMSGVVTLW